MQRSLAALPASLQSLAAQAAAQAAALEQQHGFSLQGLQQLLGAPAGTPLADAAASGGARALTGSLLLTGPAAGAQRAEERLRYAASVLQRFRGKLAGAPEGQLGSEGQPAAAAVEADVAWLIGAATSPDRLARMYEGWMPWV